MGAVLTIQDYVETPITELAQHPKFNIETFTTIVDILNISADRVAAGLRKAIRLDGPL